MDLDNFLNNGRRAQEAVEAATGKPVPVEWKLARAYLAGRLRGEYEALLAKVGKRHPPSINDARKLRALAIQGHEYEAQAGMEEQEWPQ